ncbi:MAG: cyclic pyranopterin monophosphate synthase MoaC, partial [Candidatus Hydrogenedentes bacterium]|nr:cyclic pyranopterin monophosphate synthase MoaC [Candidatus Hydrogenedentota bacterium]
MSGKERKTERTNVTGRGSARMVDVSGKAVTQRTATAEGVVRISADTLRLIEEGLLPKGNVFDVARVAGMMAAKRTAELLPMCHPIVLDDIGVEIERTNDDSLRIRASVK